MKEIDALKTKCLVAIFLPQLVGDIWRNPLFELSKTTNKSCRGIYYGAISDLFPDLRSSKMEQMKGIDVLKKLNSW